MEGMELHFSTKEGFKELIIDIFAQNNSASQLGVSIVAVVSHKTNKARSIKTISNLIWILFQNIYDSNYFSIFHFTRRSYNISNNFPIEISLFPNN